MSQKSRTSLFALATLTAFGAATLTACGRSGGSSKGTAGTSESAAPARALDDAATTVAPRSKAPDSAAPAAPGAVVTSDETSPEAVVPAAPAPAPVTSDAEAARPGLGTLAATTQGLGTLAKLATACGLVDALNDKNSNLTVFAPTDAAFQAFLGGAALPETCSPEVRTILAYHVLQVRVLSGDLKAKQSASTLAGKNERVFVTVGEGGVVVNGGSKVVTADVRAANGVAHVIDKVLVPDAFGTVVDAAVKRYSLSSLVGAVAGAGLAETLATAKNITVFAPTNSAFAKLAAVPSGEALTKVLTHHVAPQAFLAKTLLQGHVSVKTLEGSVIMVAVDAHGRASIRGSGEMASEAGRFTKTDIVTKNGVVHLIDEVLIPAGL